MGENDSWSDDRDRGHPTEEPPGRHEDLALELEQRDAAIAELQESLRIEQSVSKSLRQNIQKLDDRIGDLGDGLIDRLGTCRDLQSVLAEEKVRSESAEGELEERKRRLSELNAEAAERSCALREYQEQVDELRRKRDELKTRLAESAGRKTESNASTRGELSKREKRGRELYSLEELMAETTVLTEEDVEGEERKLAELEQPLEVTDGSAEMVSPDLMLPNAAAGGTLDENADSTVERLGTLVIFLQGRHQVKYPLHKGEITIGRSKENDIQVNSEFVSRIHARIVTTGAGAVIEDVSSKNGIVVESRSVEKHTFKDGDTATLGTTHITFYASIDSET